MFINPIEMDELVKSRQRDYRNAAEESRQTRHYPQDRSGTSAVIRVVVALSTLAFVGMTAMQLAAA